MAWIQCTRYAGRRAGGTAGGAAASAAHSPPGTPASSAARAADLGIQLPHRRHQPVGTAAGGTATCRGAAAFRRHVAPDDGASSARRPADTILGSCSRCLAQPLGRRAASWCSICCASSRSHCSTQQARQTLGQRAAHSAAPRARVAPPPPARPPHVPLSPAVGPGCRCPRPGGVGVREWVQW